MASSRVDAAILAVVAALRAAPAVTALATVYDGPFISGDIPVTAVHIGYDGDKDGDMAATAGWVQTWAGLGAYRKDEQFTLLCCVTSSWGEVDVPGRRAAVVAVLGAVEDTLRAAANIGLGLPQPTVVTFELGELYQGQGSNGMQARIPFGLLVKTRI